MISSSEDDDIIFELYKHSSVVLPERNIWSIKEISKRLLIDLKLTKEAEIVERLKKILKTLEEKEAIIFVNGFEVLTLLN